MRIYQQQLEVDRIPQQRQNTVRNRVLYITAFVLTVLVTIGIVGALRNSTGQKAVTPPPVVQEPGKIVASGTIKPYNEVKVSPKIAGLLKKLLVKQGDSVKKGQLIALMDDSNLVGQVEAARSALNLAKANYEKAMHGTKVQLAPDSDQELAKLESVMRFEVQSVTRTQATVKASQAQLFRDATNAKRMTELARQGAVSDQDRLNAVTQAEVCEVQLKQAQQEMHQAETTLNETRAEADRLTQAHTKLSKNVVREEDVRAGKFAVEQAAGNLDFLVSQLNDTKIKAPFDGVVSEKYADEGAMISPTPSAAGANATAIVALTGTLQSVTQVAENDMHVIKVGEPVEIVANAYPDKVFHGHVSLIAPEGVVISNATRFAVHSTIDDDIYHKLLAGMNVRCQILVDKQDSTQ